MPSFSCRIPVQDILVWAKRYEDDLQKDDPEWVVVGDVASRVHRSGAYTRADFLAVARWKLQAFLGHFPRLLQALEANTDEQIARTTRAALAPATPEARRVEILDTLSGVGVPVAFALLHIGTLHREKPYPMLDKRALWSLRCTPPNTYTFEFWGPYVQYCRQLAKEAGVDIRTLDRALWKYSEVNQGRPMPAQNASPGTTAATNGQIIRPGDIVELDTPAWRGYRALVAEVPGEGKVTMQVICLEHNGGRDKYFGVRQGVRIRGVAIKLIDHDDEMLKRFAPSAEPPTPLTPKTALHSPDLPMASRPSAPPPSDRPLVEMVSRPSSSGAVVGSYRLTKYLGSGAFGVVWLGEHVTAPGLRRALKFVVDPSAANSIRREFRRLTALENLNIDFRHIARLMDVVDGSPPCLVYEFIDGESLVSILHRDGPMDLERAADAIAQVLDGLAEIHRGGLVHRDLHPGNILLVDAPGGPRAKILDFGLSTRVPQGSPQDSEWSAITVDPSHPWAEPPHLRGGRHPDERTDIYSAGALLWTLVSGYPGFPAGRDLTQLAPTVRKEILGVIDCACLGARERRFASATQMKGALLKAARGPRLPWKKRGYS